MFGISSSRVGITIEQNAIRYVRLKKSKSSEMESKGCLTLPRGLIIENEITDRSVLGQSVAQWVKQEGLKGSEVNLSIPPSQIIIRRMSIPSLQPKQIEQLVKLEVETALHLPFDYPVYDYITVSQDEDHTHLLVYVAPRELIEGYIQVLTEAGVKVKSVETSATALTRAIQHASLQQEEASPDVMLIHLDAGLLDIHMLHNGQPVFMRTLDLQEADSYALPIELEKDEESVLGATKERSSGFSSSQIVEITAEISRMLNFYQYSLHDGNSRISHIIISGRSDLQEQLEHELELSHAELNIRSLVRFAEGASNAELEMYRMAVGAAIRDRAIRSINLYPQEDREARIYPMLVMSLGALWLLGGIASGILYVQGHNHVNQHSNQLQVLQEENAQLQVKLNKLSSGGANQVTNPADIIASINEMKMDAVQVVDSMQRPLPVGGALMNAAYSQNKELNVTVGFTSMSDAATYLASLRKLPFAVSTEITKLTQDNGNAGAAQIYTAVYKILMKNADQSANGEAG
ncbi:type IV pilus assembly protein PilM [Paenibacillus shirakamiensis]|uniref:Type IV pilus assembly protein PilM n=1 Tax=Paenibacillus shirakamiensis TaxID=1265935 RepID=A0ABS4JIN8_9BACL|nr:pilus assembly protein PilM [Paenibacillus shirakamiensis]MBP2001579.1 type IV pilus assembly protein PilM [Paenibacillus shirakamiensis]